METAQHNRIANFIWSIADDVLRDLYVRGKYRNMSILPMVVLRRFDAVLEPTKQDVQDGRIAGLRFYDRNEALEAAGLSE